MGGQDGIGSVGALCQNLGDGNGILEELFVHCRMIS